MKTELRYLLVNYKPVRLLIPGGAYRLCRAGEDPLTWADPIKFQQAFSWLLRCKGKGVVGMGNYVMCKRRREAAGQKMLPGFLSEQV